VAGTPPIPAISIGPITTATAKSLGIEVAAQAREYTIDGVVRAILEMCETELTPPTTQ
jgi:uroporphyrinogen-III synthase